MRLAPNSIYLRLIQNRTVKIRIYMINMCLFKEIIYVISLESQNIVNIKPLLTFCINVTI